MQARNVTIDQLEQALATINRKYAGNVEWLWGNGPEKRGRTIHFRLSVVNSDGPGAGIQPDNWGSTKAGYRRTGRACWHAHGNLFDAILAIEPNAVIQSGPSGWSMTGAVPPITRHGGNWNDWEVGSQVFPRMASENCDCSGSNEHAKPADLPNGPGYPCPYADCNARLWTLEREHGRAHERARDKRIT